MQPICKFNSRQKSARQKSRKSMKAPGLESCFGRHQNKRFIQLKQNPLFAQKRDSVPMGHTFHFLGIPGSRPKPQYIFLIHNYQLWILFYPILYTLSTTIHTIIPTKYQTISYSQISKYYSYFLSRHSISLSTIYSPPRVHFSLTKISQNTPLYPLLHILTNLSIFHKKYKKMA